MCYDIIMIDTLRDHLKKASQAQKAKYSKQDFKEWGSLSVKKRTAGMTKAEISEYFRNIQKGKRVIQVNIPIKDE